ncbi:MAG: acetamidase/formamidase family protein [Bacillota bacterium]|nr:acetamidase/formamidase family protein [Bacillota bacterium]
MRVSKQHVVYQMHRDHPAVASCRSGDTVIFETCDCFHDSVRSSTDLVSGVDFSRINPATGPLFVEGAEVGDLLKVDILSIRLESQGAIVSAPGLGRLADLIGKELTVIGEVSGDSIRILGREIPVRKMVGVIGTAPAGEAVPTGSPHDHGGNLDCTEIREGASLYLPVEVEGALLAMGDLHASMGDGEIMGAGLEIAGEVEVRVEVIKNRKLPTPFIETPDRVMTLASGKNMEEAADRAVRNMAEYLMQTTELSLEEAGMLLSMAGDLRVCQIVNPNMTMRMELDKRYLA